MQSRNRSIESLLREHDLDTKDFTSSSAYMSACELCEGMATQVQKQKEVIEKLRGVLEEWIKNVPAIDNKFKTQFRKQVESALLTAKEL